MLYITSLVLIYLITGSLYLTPLPVSGNHKSDLRNATLLIPGTQHSDLIYTTK